MSTPFTCSLCERQFHRKDKVNDHLRNAHKVRPDSEFMKTKSLFTDSSNFYGVGNVRSEAVATASSSEVPWSEDRMNLFQLSLDSRYSGQE
jgi:hypothetical protein